MMSTIIDFDAPPIIPFPGWTVYKHIGLGKGSWDPSEVGLYRAPCHMGCNEVEGYEVMEVVKLRPSYNVNLFHYLFRNQHEIPKEWECPRETCYKYIYFWNTLFLDPFFCDKTRPFLRVPFMYQDAQKKWQGEYDLVGRLWDCHRFSAEIKIARAA